MERVSLFVCGVLFVWRLWLKMSVQLVLDTDVIGCSVSVPQQVAYAHFSFSHHFKCLFL